MVASIFRIEESPIEELLLLNRVCKTSFHGHAAEPRSYPMQSNWEALLLSVLQQQLPGILD